MNTPTRNSFGLFDAPVRNIDKKPPVVVMTQKDIEAQMEAGAFLMRRADAIAKGFINPLEDPDTVVVSIRQEGV